MNILTIGQSEFKVTEPSGKETTVYTTEVTITSSDMTVITTYRVIDKSKKKHHRRYNMLTALAELDGGEGIELGK